MRNDRSKGSRGVVVACGPINVSMRANMNASRWSRSRAGWPPCATVTSAASTRRTRAIRATFYFVPSCTLNGDEAAALGIHGPDDLFGGVVPHAFVATKAISHPLVAPDAAALPGWNPAFAARVGDAVLDGYTAFNPDDARRAGSAAARQRAAAHQAGARDRRPRPVGGARRRRIAAPARAHRPGRTHHARTGARGRPERGPHLQRRPGQGGRSDGQLLRLPAADAQQPTATRFSAAPT